ncbi:hypothetical protein B0J12DRAFT_754556 [Macrophomina phaseolina]|uniref:Uncharacterized protein n=1 Tax=Macrophomina phaseolina TaxID=35725 RepID=A0ABQ8G9Y4_9PEZI|nr:hypothetical protein B0J12DRAFT_754556 [Macrophomina phaseolina]
MTEKQRLVDHFGEPNFLVEMVHSTEEVFNDIATCMSVLGTLFVLSGVYLSCWLSMTRKQSWNVASMAALSTFLIFTAETMVRLIRAVACIPPGEHTNGSCWVPKELLALVIVFSLVVEDSLFLDALLLDCTLQMPYNTKFALKASIMAMNSAHAIVVPRYYGRLSGEPFFRNKRKTSDMEIADWLIVYTFSAQRT